MSRRPRRLDGTMADDRLDGGPGNDVLNGHGGNDNIDGNVGVDTFILDASTADVLAHRADLAWTAGQITKIGSTLGVVQLSSIERVQLTDGLYAFDTPAPELTHPEGAR